MNHRQRNAYPYYIGLSLLLLLFVPVLTQTSVMAAPGAQADPPVSVTLDNGYQITFHSVTANLDGTSTWRYAVVALPDAKKLQHWVLAIPACATTMTADPVAWEAVSPDPTTRLHGIKWETAKAFQQGEFTVTLAGHLAVGIVQVAAKGPQVAQGLIAGPTCESGATPLPTVPAVPTATDTPSPSSPPTLTATAMATPTDTPSPTMTMTPPAMPTVTRTATPHPTVNTPATVVPPPTQTPPPTTPPPPTGLPTLTRTAVAISTDTPVPTMTATRPVMATATGITTLPPTMTTPATAMATLTHTPSPTTLPSTAATETRTATPLPTITTPTAPAALQLPVTKTDYLWIDADEDQVASVGDTLLYAIKITNHNPAAVTDLTVHDSLPATTRLLFGTVQTNQGIVVMGNQVGDNQAVADMGTLGSGESATLTFQVQLLPQVTATHLDNQAIITFRSSLGQNNELITTVSDDPDTTERFDTTITPVKGRDPVIYLPLIER